MQRRNRFQDRFDFRDGSQAEDLPLVEILEDLRTLGIGALRQHGELLPAVHEKCYAMASEKKVMPDTNPGDFHHRVWERHSFQSCRSWLSILGGAALPALRYATRFRLR